MSEPQVESIEKQHRSRSKTPIFNLRVSAEREQNGADASPGRKVHKKPTVGMIEEKDELQSGQSSEKSGPPTGGQTRSTAVRKTRVVTSDYSSDDISPERVRAAAAAVLVASANEQLAKTTAQLSQSTVTTTSTITTSVVMRGQQQEQTQKSTASKVVVNDSAVASSSPKKDAAGPQITALPTAGVTQESKMGTAKKATTGIRTSTPKNAAPVTRSSTKAALTPEELQQFVAYKEYREAGEYWNKYPKTDYTYSELSPHRRELAQGMVAMPNMSRPSLFKHAERVQTMIQRDPMREAYIRERYAAGNLFGTRRQDSDSYDSTDELDGADYRRQLHFNAEGRSIVSRFFLSIVTFLYSSFHSFRSLFVKRTDERQQYYTRIEDERGFFTRVYGHVASFFISVFKRIYLLISSVLFLDAWLLQTVATGTEQQQQAVGQRKRRYLLFLLVLLPFLLIGAYLLADEEQTIVLPASSRATLALSSLSRVLPDGIKNAEATVEQLYQYVSSATIDSWPTLSLPTVGWSIVPSFAWLTNFAWPWWPRSTTSNNPETSALRDTLRKTLSREEYNELMHHIDAYIDGLMEQKYASRMASPESPPKEGAVTPEITVHMAHVIEQSLKSYNYQLTDSDVEKVAQQVHQTLLLSYPALFEQGSKEEPADSKVTLTKEYIAQIQRLVEQQISVTNNQYVITGPQLEDLLTRILASEGLLTLIDQRIDTKHGEASRVASEQRDALVDALRKELTDIKDHFNEQLLSSSLQWEERLRLVSQNQAQLDDQLRAYRLENDRLYQKLLADLDGRLGALRTERFEGINRVVRENILTILGLNVQQDIPDGDLRSWINGVFVAREHLEQRLVELRETVKADRQSDIEQNAARLMKDIGDQIRSEMLARFEEVRSETVDAVRTKTDSSDDGGSGGGGGTLTEDDVKRIVRDALVIYDADKTGRVDYALETAGGQVLSTRCTENYKSHSAEFRIFGIPIWYPSNTPRTVISPTMEPGQCWAFQGFPGYLVIQLNTRIVVTGFTLEHISKLLVANGSISSAPKAFTVWGLQNLNDPDPVLLGSYEYRDVPDSSLQYFPVQNKQWQEPLQIVELRIESNHGNVHYTCLYRFRVHGTKT
ncbi:klaroid protein [Anopheles cruzii]|uniref:klaroid protein n=1 Tax=Anopheles cruzii TaxID=68878 RepID=UPI0022EC27DE|nr:klaroid protein [Anopheles cruzii]